MQQYPCNDSNKDIIQQSHKSAIWHSARYTLLAEKLIQHEILTSRNTILIYLAHDYRVFRCWKFVNFNLAPLQHYNGRKRNILEWSLNVKKPHHNGEDQQLEVIQMDTITCEENKNKEALWQLLLQVIKFTNKSNGQWIQLRQYTYIPLVRNC